MDRDGRVPKPLRDDLCIICKLDFESHRWITPAGWIAKGTKDAMGHDWTPRIGDPVRHPHFPPGVRP